LSQGFHIISVPILPDWIPISTENGGAEDLLTCVLTAEADPREIFTLDEGLLEMTATSFLQVDVASISEICSGFM
jgi:hypothetical protein